MKVYYEFEKSWKIRTTNKHLKNVHLESFE